MSEWTPEELHRVLDGREPARLRELVVYLSKAVRAGRARLLVEKPWLNSASRSREDDMQEVLAALFNDRPPPDARILRRFGSYPDFVMRKDALSFFVMGVTKNILQRVYRKYRVGWEELTEDLVMLDPSPDRTSLHTGLPTWLVELEAAVNKLAPDQYELFYLIYGEHLDCPEVCARYGITADVFHARKSRLLKRLRRLLQGDET